MSEIQAASVVKLHCKIRLKDGSVAEDTHDNGPAMLKMGAGQLSEVAEEQLLGLKAGSKKNILLEAPDAFGERHPANVYQMPRSQFARTDLGAELEPGLMILFDQPNGTQLPGVIRECAEDEVTVDFNHPLAGEPVVLQVEILEVDQ